ncbi:PhoX family protein [Halomonadaceae bacterium KBTZ08]
MGQDDQTLNLPGKHRPKRGKTSPSKRNNQSTPFRNIVQARLSRRDALRGSLEMAAGTLFVGAGLSACSSDGGNGGEAGGGGSDSGRVAQLSFDSVQGVAGENVNDVVLPEGYTFDVLIPWGTGILGSFPGFNADGSNTADEQNQQSGEWHDGMHFFPINGADNRGLLVVNHESLDMLFFHGYTLDGEGNPVPNRETDPDTDLPTNADQVRKEMASHGVSVVEIQRMSGRWRITDTGMNRRITAETPVTFSGPAANSEVLQTKFSPSGAQGRGTINNCGRGFTPWNTYLTCEENFRGYVTTQEDPVPEEKNRYALTNFGFGYRWDGVAGDSSEADGNFARWDTTPKGNSASDDFRNEANHFGWIVEIDPFDPNSTPVKRTAMGRFAHEGAEPGRIEAGKPIAFYCGDDDENEYIYKFVTADNWNPDNPNRDMLDNGTLYAAQFSEDGTGKWLALDISNPTLQSRFSSQAEVVTYARIAADLLEATPMDRPEWSTTDPNTGEIYFNLTNNDEKGDDAKDRNVTDSPNSANPRDPNLWGHIIRLRENDDAPGATRFSWNIFAFGAPAGESESVNRSGLTEANQFAGPDGLFFDPRGVMWIETDNGGNAVAEATNDQLLAVVPAGLGGDRTLNSQNQASLKRFFVGPGRCEVTGIVLSPDARTLFINVQHPGQSFGSRPSHSFPAKGNGDPGNLPRSTTLAIRREDDGEIAL